MIPVDGDRLHADFLELSAIGAVAGGGISRTTFSDAHLKARAWFHRRAAEAGLETGVDPAGNHSAVLRGSAGPGRTLLMGSHLDTVPLGGRYDGALGVLAALEALRAAKDAGVTLPVNLEAIDFTDEEGSLLGLLGSFALTGALTVEMLAAPRGGRAHFRAALARGGLSEEALRQARRDPDSLAAYLELHIEQGSRLEAAGADIGVVTAIAGSRSYRIAYTGARRHAGTTPMDARQDALLGAARFALSVRDTVLRFPECVGTVGALEVERGAFNVVPGRAEMLLELRAPSTPQLDAVEEAVLDGASDLARSEALSLTVERVGRWEPVGLDSDIQNVITETARELGLRSLPVSSGAGHDAQALAALTPTGMIFVPSAAGVSHDPAEHTRWEDCLNGANVLLGTALRVAMAAAC
ncbi:MAG TPA: M20 family metallo-hydrolase [Solirubrobacteraceae bacterium]|nr:M20 family metallo-hydrolase [Solirubrobacteraceae bacterium]